MHYLEVKLLLMLIFSWEIAEISGIDLLIKIIPASVVTGFTIYKWIKLYKQDKK